MNPTLHKSIPSKNRREIRLLLLCAGRSLDRETAEQIKSLSTEDIDWHYLVKMASLHKLQFLVYRSLNIACPEAVNHPTLKQLGTHYKRNVAYSLRMTRQLFEIIDLLDDHGIQAMPFKGPVLSELAYGDLTLRPIGDLDLLVDRQNAFKSIDLFIDQGFRTEIDLDHKQFRAYAAKKNSMAMVNPDSDLTLDLHWAMTGKWSYEPVVLDRMNKDLFPVTLAGRTVLQPRLETLLVYLISHSTQECWKDMEAVSSIAGLIAGHDHWDWTRVDRMADRMRCKRMVLLGLVLARDLFDTELPATILKAVADNPVVINLAADVCKYLFETSEPEMVENRKSKFSTFQFRARDRWSEKLRYSRYLLLNATVQDWNRFPLPARLSFLHTFLRPLRLSMTFFSRAMGGKGQGQMELGMRNAECGKLKQKSVVRGQMSEDRRQRAEDRSQRLEDRRQRAEDRRQRAEDRSQRSEGR